MTGDLEWRSRKHFADSLLLDKLVLFCLFLELDVFKSSLRDFIPDLNDE